MHPKSYTLLEVHIIMGKTEKAKKLAGIQNKCYSFLC